MSISLRQSWSSYTSDQFHDTQSQRFEDIELNEMSNQQSNQEAGDVTPPPRRGAAQEDSPQVDGCAIPGLRRVTLERLPKAERPERRIRINTVILIITAIGTIASLLVQTAQWLEGRVSRQLYVPLWMQRFLGFSDD
jgi:hypothetical protein